MKHLKHWKWQLALSGPFLPWAYVHHMDYTYQTAKSLGWGEIAPGLATALLTMGMTALLVAAFCKFHEEDD